jgi:hypothetical protein
VFWGSHPLGEGGGLRATPEVALPLNSLSELHLMLSTSKATPFPLSLHLEIQTAFKPYSNDFRILFLRFGLRVFE